MAVTASITKVKAMLLLNNGTTTTGAVKTKAVSLPAMKKTFNANTDDVKIVAICNALYPICDLAAYGVQRDMSYELSEE